MRRGSPQQEAEEEEEEEEENQRASSRAIYLQLIARLTSRSFVASCQSGTVLEAALTAIRLTSSLLFSRQP